MVIRPAFVSFNTKVLPIGSAEQAPNWGEEGHTPYVFAKSAQTIEGKGDELRDSAKERSKSAQ